MTLWLRPLLILVLALMATPRVMASDGEWAVICAADGSRQVVLFDFETGAPVEQDVTFETCDHCLTPPLAADAQDAAIPLRLDAASQDAPFTHISAAHLIAVAASARGPPTI